MSPRRARWLLWAAGVLLLPLPLWMVTEGCVPVVRFALLAAVSGAYALFVDGSGVAWVMTAILVGHALVYALALLIPVRLVVRWLPERARAPIVWALVGIGFGTALAFDIYRTPFADVARTSWLGLFR